MNKIGNFYTAVSQDDSIRHDYVVDVTGLCCRMDVKRTRKILYRMTNAQILKVIWDEPDRSELEDFIVYFEDSEYEIVDKLSNGDTVFVYLKIP